MLSILAVLLTLTAPAFALEVPPPPTQWVTDQAGILSQSDLQSLNEKLRQFEDRSGAQFIIYIFRSLEGESLEDFTIRAAERWKVGQKKYDNGLILFVFVEDRKTRIEVGYGLEPTITDAFASRVLREVIPPYFRRGEYAGGLHAAADQLIARIEGKEPPTPATTTSADRPGFSLSDLIFLLVIIGIFMLFVGPLARRQRRRHGCGGCVLPIPTGGVTFGGGGGGWSGGGGGFSGGGGSFGGGGASGSW